MKHDSSQLTDQHKVWKMIADIDVAILTTIDDEDGLRGRPMSTIVREEDGLIFMLTDKMGHKDEELRRDSNLMLSYSKGGTDYVCVNGNATISDDRALINSLWSPGAQAFWPKGPADENVIALVVTPTKAEYWESNSGLLNSVRMVFAAATGSKPDLGENKRVSL